MDGSLTDIVGGNNLEIIQNGTLVEDRNGNANSALQFINGYAYAPADVYFDPATGGSTIMLWAKFSSLENFQRLIDFGIPKLTGSRGYDLFFIGIRDGHIFVLIKNDDVETFYQTNLYEITLNNWFHYTVSINPITLKVATYVNGTIEGTFDMAGKYI